MVSALHVHLVFVTKYRRGVLDADMLRCCQDTMRKVCGDLGAELRESNGEEDHVHLLVEYPPNVAISALVNNPKGVPTRKLRWQFTGRVNRHIMHGHFWFRPTSPHMAAVRRRASSGRTSTSKDVRLK